MTILTVQSEMQVSYQCIVVDSRRKKKLRLEINWKVKSGYRRKTFTDVAMEGGF